MTDSPKRHRGPSETEPQSEPLPNDFKEKVVDSVPVEVVLANGVQVEKSDFGFGTWLLVEEEEKIKGCLCELLVFSCCLLAGLVTLPGLAALLGLTLGSSEAVLVALGCLLGTSARVMTLQHRLMAMLSWLLQFLLFRQGRMMPAVALPLISAGIIYVNRERSSLMAADWVNLMENMNWVMGVFNLTSPLEKIGQEAQKLVASVFIFQAVYRVTGAVYARSSRRQFPYLVNIMGGFAGLMIGWVTRNLWFNMVSPADPFSLKSIVNVTLIGVHFFLPGYSARRALPANPEDASLALLLIHFLLLALMFDERASSWTRVGNGMLWSRGICSFSACWLS
ncbi:unnamed protein product [Effrenium voratum]|uniref:Uncharacterized protein n=1 Tax=Effrenium voratum TaxID=2562239 RepID=A0AA36MNK4_9DINO|nr:unnamed protein product [Effrenium voratum]